MIACPTCARLQTNNADRCDRCGADLSQLEGDPLEGATLAGFALGELIGAGAMGKVYRGVRQASGEPAAIKVLHRHLLGDRTLKARFQREALAASRLDHPRCIRVLSFGEAETGDLYIAMELLEGMDLAEALEQDFPMPFERLHYITAQICEALGEAHGKGIIHRDLKPENVFLVSDARGRDQVKVLDFGIAKIQSGEGSQDTTSTRMGRVAGTPEYMAPEQARGEVLDPRADLYAFGVTLFLLFTGRLPFTGDSPLAVVTDHLTEPAPDPRLINPDVFVPDALAEVILACLSKTPEGRPGSAAELGRLLREALREPVALHLQPQRSIIRPVAMRSGMYFKEQRPEAEDASRSGSSSVVITDATGEIDDLAAFGIEPTAGLPHALFRDLAVEALRDTTDEGDFTGEATALHAHTFPGEVSFGGEEEKTTLRPAPRLSMEPTAPLPSRGYIPELTIPEPPRLRADDLDGPTTARRMTPPPAALLAKAPPAASSSSSRLAVHAAQGEATTVGLSAMASDAAEHDAAPEPGAPRRRGLSTGAVVLLVLCGVGLGLGLGALLFWLAAG